MNGHTRKKVLILCTGNSCRSQMAEALINARLGDSWQAWSAGTHPTGFVHLLAITVLNEIGIRHFGQSKKITELPQKDFDLVITVCDDAAEKCPLWLGMGRRVHINLPDPSQEEGTEQERLAAFRSLRDEIAEKVIGYLKKYSAHDQDQTRSSDE
jgi:arsenate reductase